MASLIIMLATALSLGVIYLRSKGILKPSKEAEEFLNNAERVTKIIAIITKKFVDDGYDELIDRLEDVIRTTTQYGQAMLNLSDGQFISEDRMLQYAFELCSDLKIDLDDEEIEVLKSVVSLIYILVINR